MSFNSPWHNLKAKVKREYQVTKSGLEIMRILGQGVRTRQIIDVLAISLQYSKGQFQTQLSLKKQVVFV